MHKTFACPSTWPGLHDGVLRLPLDADWLPLRTQGFQRDRESFQRKDEFHITLLDRDATARTVAALGESGLRSMFETTDWGGERTGEGVLITATEPPLRSSLIERLDMPVFHAFRRAVAAAAGIELPEAPPHVTLYTAGDAKGIGVPDLAALHAMRVAGLRLPGIGNRQGPALEPAQRSAYCAAEYAVDDLGTSVHIGNVCPVIIRELARRSVQRAVIITAWNPFSESCSEAGNTLRQRFLLDEIAAEGLDVVDAEGRDPDGAWSPEPSLLVFGTSASLEARWLADFEQHALVLLQPDAPAALVVHPHASA